MSVSNPNSVSTCVGWIEPMRNSLAVGAISSIADLNGDAPAMTFAQGTGANQPSYVVSDSALTPHLSFTTNDYMDTAGIVTFAGAFAIAAVIRCDDISTNQIWFGHSVNSNKFGVVGSKIFIRTVNGDFSENTQSWTPGNGVWGALLYERDAADAVTLQIDGGSQVSINTQAGNSLWERIGNDNAGLYMEGDIAHVSFYDGALTTATRQDINDYMRWLTFREAWSNDWASRRRAAP